MSTTEQRLAANRINALCSTGPTSQGGKAIASQNATRHGLLSARLFLDDDDPDQFQALFEELCASLVPVGSLEITLVERIAVTLWRQRRLVQSETASLSLARQPKQVARGVALELGRTHDFKQDELEQFDADRKHWCEQVVAEIEGLEDFDFTALEKSAPFVFEQLKSEAAEDDEPLEKFVADYEGGLTGFIVKLVQWCREQLQVAKSRPNIMAIAEQVKAKRLVLPSETLEMLARYQTTLDNQLFKSLRALRDAQEWRLKAIEPVGDLRSATPYIVAETA